MQFKSLTYGRVKASVPLRLLGWRRWGIEVHDVVNRLNTVVSYLGLPRHTVKVAALMPAVGVWVPACDLGGELGRNEDHDDPADAAEEEPQEESEHGPVLGSADEISDDAADNDPEK